MANLPLACINAAEEYNLLFSRFCDGVIERNIDPKLAHLGHCVQEMSSKLNRLCESVRLLDSRVTQTGEASSGKHDHMQNEIESAKVKLKHLSRALQGKASTEQVDQLTQKLSKSDARMDLLERALESKGAHDILEKVQMECGETGSKINILFDATQRYETANIDVARQICSIQEALHDKANTSALRHLVSKFSCVDSQISSMKEAIDGKVVQMESSIRHVHGQLSSMEETLSGKVENEQMQQVVLSLSDATRQLPLLTSALRTKADSDQVHQNRELAADLQQKMQDLEQTMRDQAESIDETKMLLGEARNSLATLEAPAHHNQLRQIECSLVEIRKQVSGLDLQIRERVTAAQMEHIESVVNRIQARAQDLESSLLEKANASQIQQLRTAHSLTESQISDFESCLQEKVSIGQLQYLKNSVATLEAKVGCIDFAMQDKVGIGQLQQLKSQCCEIQSNVAEIGSSIKDTLIGDQLRQITSQICSLHDQFRALVQSMGEKADEKQLHEVRNSLNTIASRISSVDDKVSEKAHAVELRNLRDLLISVANRLKSMEVGLRECMTSVEGLDEAVVAVNARAAKAVNEKVSQMQDVIGAISHMRSRIGSIEHALRLGQDRMVQVEDCIASLSQTPNSKVASRIDNISGAIIGVARLESSLQATSIPEKRSYSRHMTFAG